MSTEALLAKLKKSRQLIVEAGGYRFTCRRPTAAEAISLADVSPFDFAATFVVDWDLLEHQLIPGGGAEKVPFDAALMREWISDRPDLWEPIALPIMDAYRKAAERLEASTKN